MSFTVDVKEEDKGVFTAYCQGSLDTTTYSEFEKEINSLLRENVKVVILNMEKVSYISSMGVSSILEAKRRFEEEGIVFILLDLQPQVKKVFDIIKAFPVQTIFTSVEELDGYLKSIQDKYKEEDKN
ncbi:MAG TPA: anti-sigma factor antagonist [Candidatus Omnitrophica bacterium]|nr:MAG: anti-sigma factor antagonist [Candidatus Omnitrophota bacterium]RKY34887.1 MAG: anti-sigma factor antagonist [Candidatus Omnitrophota bacterium]RKY42801.1 MAG: anti-sigma factor antagonist [Candidatus Omnitrophota bacterium]HEC69674.1 anti-sigma factor antagonist [Candidatus Omnitrophota bacterium]